MISCKDNTTQSSSNLNEPNRLSVTHGDDKYTILKHSFGIFDAHREPLFRIWIFGVTGDNYGIYRSKGFAGLYELDIGNIDTTYDIMHKEKKELYPKSGWVKFNTKIKENDIWGIPRFPLNDSIKEERYPKNGLEIEFITRVESYSVTLSGNLNMQQLHDKKSVAITSLFQMLKEEFGIDFMNYNFDGQH
jgi:hypothetical protein